ncbi:MAG: nucleoside deaminase [Elusimicrobia bacterium]|nr:nucleoside deaminase [Elusimicrobiota bacterium]
MDSKNYGDQIAIDAQFMRMALDIARRALEVGELPIAAILVLDEDVLAGAHNLVAGDNDRLAHSELLVLRAASPKLKAMKIIDRSRLALYSTLEPCMMCFGAIMNHNIGKVCYALESPGDGVLPLVLQWEKKSEQLPYYKTPAIVPGILRSESAGLFREFVRKHPKSRFAKWAHQLSTVLGLDAGS